MKTLLSILLVTTISMAGPLSWAADKIKDLLINDKKSTTITETKGKELNYDTVGKISKGIVIIYGVVAIESFASEVENEINSAKNDGIKTYTPLMCGDKVVPSTFDQCPNKEDTLRYGNPITL